MPMSMMADVLLKKVEYPCIFYLGTVPMLLAFLTVSLLSHYDNWDPVMDLVKGFYTWIFRRGRTMRYERGIFLESLSAFLLNTKTPQSLYRITEFLI